MLIEEHIQYWIESADSDLDTAEALFSAEKYDWCLFLGHLVLEKLLKAHYVRDNGNKMPPRIHNLIKLSEKTKIILTDDQKEFLNTVTDFNLEVRYPEYKRGFQRKCTREFCEKTFSEIKESYKWLKSQNGRLVE